MTIELPPELFTQWLAEAMMEHGTKPGTVASIVARKAAQWGADQDLEACIQMLDINGCPGKWIDMLRDFRRPEALSLKQRALKAAQIELNPEGKNGSLIIHALEALPDD